MTGHNAENCEGENDVPNNIRQSPTDEIVDNLLGDINFPALIAEMNPNFLPAGYLQYLEDEYELFETPSTGDEIHLVYGIEDNDFDPLPYLNMIRPEHLIPRFPQQLEPADENQPDQINEITSEELPPEEENIQIAEPELSSDQEEVAPSDNTELLN